MLACRGVKVESHEGAKIKFGELFARTDEVPREFGRMLNDALSFGKMLIMRLTAELKYPAKLRNKNSVRRRNS